MLTPVAAAHLLSPTSEDAMNLKGQRVFHRVGFRIRCRTVGNVRMKIPIDGGGFKDDGVGLVVLGGTATVPSTGLTTSMDRSCLVLAILILVAHVMLPCIRSLCTRTKQIPSVP